MDAGINHQRLSSFGANRKIWGVQILIKTNYSFFYTKWFAESKEVLLNLSVCSLNIALDLLKCCHLKCQVVSYFGDVVIEILLYQILSVELLFIYPSKIKELLFNPIRVTINVIVDLLSLSIYLELGIKSLRLMILGRDRLKPLFIDRIYPSVNSDTIKKLNGLVNESNMLSL